MSADARPQPAPYSERLPTRASTGRLEPLLYYLFKTFSQPLLLCDRRMMVLEANRAAVRLLGKSALALRNNHAADLLPRTGRAKPSLAESALSWRSEIKSPRQRRTVEVSGRFLDDPVRAGQGWILALRDAVPDQDVPDFVGSSAVVQELLDFVARVAPSKAAAILLLGESGTGKELIARRLHGLSRRGGGPFVAINCAALPADLLESELFGHEKGAFTGSGEAKAGLMEMAGGGTFFLDEIGELTLSVQAKLLRALDDHTVRRVGGTRNIAVDVRIISATNTNLERAVEDGRFRSDLYHRMNTVQISLLPLREHPEDIAELAHHFLTRFNRVHGRSLRGIHPAALQILKFYSWPGNARELRNVMERAVLVESSPLVTPESLSLFRRGAAVSGGKPPGTALSLRSSERELIAVALQEAKGNQSRAAAQLGIGRFSLRYKMKKLGML